VGAMCNKHVHLTMTRSSQLSYRCHKKTDHGRVVDITCIPTICSRDPDHAHLGNTHHKTKTHGRPVYKI